MTSMLAEVSESEAQGSLADDYQAVRGLLGFVPTIYRVLAPYPAAFAGALESLRLTTSLADESTSELQRVAAGGARGESPPVPSPSARSVMSRYRAANPTNLLVCLGLLGNDDPEWPGVMTPEALPDHTGSLEEQILRRHGSLIIPGLWRELQSSAPDCVTLWRWLDAASAGGELVERRNAVRATAGEALARAGARSVDLDSVPAEVRRLLGWFPTGIATMIVEAEWLLASSSTVTRTSSKESS